LFQAIHEAVPTPQAELAKASSAAELKQACVSIPRAERQLVTLQSVNMDYVADVNNPRWLDSLVDLDKPIHDFTSETSFEGFVIKIVCRTPNQGGVKFIDQHFMQALRRIGRKAGAPFYFDRVSLIRGETVEQAGASSGGSWGANRGGWAGGGGRGGATSVDGISKDTTTLDPLTGESVLSDWEFEIWVDGFVGDYAEVAPPDEGESDEG
jgi:hypothetical protein